MDATRRTRLLGLWLLAALSLAQPSRASDSGVLPKDDSPPAPPPEASKPKAHAAPAKSPGTDDASSTSNSHSCFMDLSVPPGGNAVFAGDGILYFLAQTDKANSQKAGVKGKAARQTQAELAKVGYTLFKVNLKTQQSERLAAFDHLIQASLLTYGNPAETAIAIAFSGSRATCFSGPAALLDINLGKGESKAMRAVGQYEIVAAPLGRMLVELKKHMIISIDPTTFQRKALRSIPEGERGLYFDPIKNELTTWTEDGEERGLARYIGRGDSAATQLSIKKGERVLQQGGLFAVAHFNGKQNSIDIQPQTGWSGEQKSARFTITLPLAYPVVSAGIEIDFKNHIALVFGANFSAKLRWQRVFIFDYQSGKMLTAMPVSGSQYLNYVGIDPSSSFAFVEVRDQATKRTTGVKLYDIAKKGFIDVNLDLGNELGAK